MDREAMTRAIQAFVDAIGERFDGDDMEKTAARVAKAWSEDLLAGYAVDPDEALTWGQAPAHSGLVAVRDISFASVCVHHLLPFSGRAHIAYLPHERLAGLSKIGRVVEAHARRLQIQERLAAEVVATLERQLQPRGVVALFEAEHTCMTLRGCRKEQSRMITVNASGVYEQDAAARREVLELLRGGSGSDR